MKKFFDINDIDLHTTLCWKAVTEAIQDPHSIHEMCYEEFCDIYKENLMEYILYLNGKIFLSDHSSNYVH